MQQANIKVAVRIRPLLEEEVQAGQTSTKLEVDQENNCINVFNDRSSIYKNSQFDYVIDRSASQRKVYDRVGISDLVKAVVEGYHATIFAYGQTGSGKTFTMEGYKYKSNEKGVPVPIIERTESEGIVPRAIFQLFDLIKKQSSLQTKRFTIYCSYLQIYKEKIYDLLNKAQLRHLTNDGPGLKLKWNKNDHFSVENLYTFECRSPDDIMALYHFGIRNKVVSSHNMNSASSRSHTMLSLTLEQVDINSPDNIITSKLQLVDLAGSERQGFTGTAANKESIDINKSLFTLRQVITALTEKKHQVTGVGNLGGQYIPYRESKLTSLLRQSLGGNSYCLMIACLNPCDLYIEENISTLQYAGKASFISNKPVKNDDPKVRLIEQLKQENKILTEELAKANETIQFLSQLTGNNPKTVQANLKNVQLPNPLDLSHINKIVLGEPNQQKHEGLTQQPGGDLPPRQGSASSAITEKRGGDQVIKGSTERLIKDKDNIERFFKEKSETLQQIANMNKPMSNANQPTGPSAVNESKDAITERIIHTVNMMKEVLQSNLSLRETIQKQSEMIDNLNAEIFQLQTENEDLRDRVQILEEYTGKDTYSDLTKLVKEKKVLENRVKHLEQTSMNWAQFQATRSHFHQSKEHVVNQSQGGLQPKATLDHQFNDDYEPVRCAIVPQTEEKEEDDQDAHYVLQEMQRMNNGQVSKKRKKLQQINLQRQFQRGKSIQPSSAAIQIIQQYQDQPRQSELTPLAGAVANGQGHDKHQEYKIRTVKSLAQAYQQQHHAQQQLQQQLRAQGQTSKNQTNGRFNRLPPSSIGTYYDKPRNSIGAFGVNSGGNVSTMNKFNGNNTQELSYDDARATQYPNMDATRNRSPLLGQNQSSKGAKIAAFQKQHSMLEQPLGSNQQLGMKAGMRNLTVLGGEASQQSSTMDFFPKELFSRDRPNKDGVPMTQPHITLRRKEQEEGMIDSNLAVRSGGGSRPPKSPNKYSSNKKNSNRMTMQQDIAERERLNISADYISNTRQAIEGFGDPYNQRQHEKLRTGGGKGEFDNDSDDHQGFYEYEDNDGVRDDEQLSPGADAYEAMRIQKLKSLQKQQQQQLLQRGDNGIGQLDVSLPMIK